MEPSRPSTRRVYPKPPVREALVAFFFVGAREQIFDPTLAGRLRLQSELLDAYPRTELPQAQPLRWGRLELESEVNQLRFCSADDLQLLLLMPGVLSVHRLRPYLSWEMFREQVAQALAVYTRISSLNRVQRVGVRYINAWEVGGWEELAEHLVEVGRPLIFDGTPPRSLVRHQEYAVSEREPLAVRQACTCEEERYEVTLDVDAAEFHPDGFAVSEVLERVDRLHDRVAQAFEQMITDKAREGFQ